MASGMGEETVYGVSSVLGQYVGKTVLRSENAGFSPLGKMRVPRSDTKSDRDALFCLTPVNGVSKLSGFVA